ncbi:PilZ domain-containing protein [Candidatus Woesearchaeota archaeon]|nr:PilZ domain-containing protein [Candidatus Woesearchaeota archaeon]
MITGEKKKSASEYAERRKTQRILTRFRVEFADGSDGSTVDISEAGACLASSSLVELDAAEINLLLPFKPVELKVNRVWSRQDAKTKEFF